MVEFKRFEHKKCEYYPCHKVKRMNCLFCFCPLYAYDCGGDFIILKNGVKDCSGCNLPHEEKGYDYITAFLESVAKNIK